MLPRRERSAVPTPCSSPAACGPSRLPPAPPRPLPKARRPRRRLPSSGETPPRRWWRRVAPPPRPTYTAVDVTTRGGGGAAASELPAPLRPLLGSPKVAGSAPTATRPHTVTATGCRSSTTTSNREQASRACPAPSDTRKATHAGEGGPLVAEMGAGKGATKVKGRDGKKGMAADAAAAAATGFIAVAGVATAPRAATAVSPTSLPATEAATTDGAAAEEAEASWGPAAPTTARASARSPSGGSSSASSSSAVPHSRDATDLSVRPLQRVAHAALPRPPPPPSPVLVAHPSAERPTDGPGAALRGGPTSRTHTGACPTPPPAAPAAPPPLSHCVPSRAPVTTAARRRPPPLQLPPLNAASSPRAEEMGAPTATERVTAATWVPAGAAQAAVDTSQAASPPCWSATTSTAAAAGGGWVPTVRPPRTLELGGRRRAQRSRQWPWRGPLKSTSPAPPWPPDVRVHANAHGGDPTLASLPSNPPDEGWVVATMTAEAVVATITAEAVVAAADG